MWSSLSRPRSIAWRNLLLLRRSNSQWRAPPPPYRSEHPTLVNFLWRHKPTVLMASVLLLIFQDYHKQKSLFEQPDSESQATFALFALQAVDKQYDQVDFDDPAQNLSYFKRLHGNFVFWKYLDNCVAIMKDDPQGEEKVYAIFRRAARDLHLALAKYDEEGIVELGKRVLAIKEDSVQEMNMFVMKQRK
ncbi:hypothetical protein D9619_002483 [Psilocybe cf. subviscida]|uniref:Uncharacterized protein n=1 Tax=Psilocybe cf. subviscida TaxID=2480587 RepID=A0A8H5EUF4_9AGAR|nr:hypothetical protein D9619_002483 [Psilocybe cf. subviscida]